jgi:hypothetical protein
LKKEKKKVSDAVREQPWLPNGPIPTLTSWSRAGDAVVPNQSGEPTGRNVSVRTTA